MRSSSRTAMHATGLARQTKESSSQVPPSTQPAAAVNTEDCATVHAAAALKRAAACLLDGWPRRGSRRAVGEKSGIFEFYNQEWWTANASQYLVMNSLHKVIRTSSEFFSKWPIAEVSTFRWDVLVSDNVQEGWRGVLPQKWWSSK